MYICDECLWKFDPDETDNCPMCGEPTPEEPKMVRQWNSTLKANPKKRPKRSPIKPSRRGNELKEVMKERARIEIAEAKAEGRLVRCGHCGKRIQEIKYENISHRQSRSVAPEKRTSLENLDFLCGPMDYWGQVDKSCHTLWGQNRIKEFEAKKNKFKPS